MVGAIPIHVTGPTLFINYGASFFEHIYILLLIKIANPVGNKECIILVVSRIGDKFDPLTNLQNFPICIQMKIIKKI